MNKCKNSGTNNSNSCISIFNASSIAQSVPAENDTTFGDNLSTRDKTNNSSISKPQLSNQSVYYEFKVEDLRTKYKKAAEILRKYNLLAISTNLSISKTLVMENELSEFQEIIKEEYEPDF